MWRILTIQCLTASLVFTLKMGGKVSVMLRGGVLVILLEKDEKEDEKHDC